MNDCAELERRIKMILPDEYQDCYEDVEPVSMGSAGLRFAPDGRVAWNEMWATFCDLALAGGPPHKGTLLEPAAKAEVDREPGRYSAVVEEICRGVRMVTDLEVNRSSRAGWVRVACLSDTMAGWLLRAITMENVAVRAEGATIELPAGPQFRVEKEIKNVVTVMAKTCHYWLGHTTRRQKQQIAQMFVALSEESTLLVPALSEGGTTARVATEAGLSIKREIGLPVSSRRYAGWLGVECSTVRAALWMTRALVVSNVLSRREETTLFLPVNAEQDPDGHRIAGAMIRTHGLAGARGVL
jgi:sirohydrochlorin cobaltochelatase